MGPTRCSGSGVRVRILRAQSFRLCAEALSVQLRGGYSHDEDHESWVVLKAQLSLA